MLCREATFLEIQLELIRRSSFNFYDGELVFRDLLAQRALWKAALIDRPGPGHLIKLRDLDDGYWNVDTLYVLARDERSARTLSDFEERWGADSVIVYDDDATREAIGTGEEISERLITFWWD